MFSPIVSRWSIKCLSQSNERERERKRNAILSHPIWFSYTITGTKFELVSKVINEITKRNSGIGTSKLIITFPHSSGKKIEITCQWNAIFTSSSPADPISIAVKVSFLRGKNERGKGNYCDCSLGFVLCSLINFPL